MTAERVVFGKSGESLSDREREILAEAIHETDWAETPVLDVVKYRPVARSDSPNRPEYEVHRPDELPDYSAYADPARAHTVYRLTEDSCEEMGFDPETGDVVEGGRPRRENE
jgi:hypothetical protein